MKNDTNPSVLFMAYTTPKADALFKEELKKKGLQVRELKLYDVSIPLDRYNEVINWFKEFCSGINLRLIEAVTGNFFIKFFLKKIEKKTDYKLIKTKWNWQSQNRHKLKQLGLTPIACEYRERYKETFCSSEEEKELYDKLQFFESEGYKAPTLREEGIFEERDMRLYKNRGKNNVL